MFHKIEIRQNHNDIDAFLIDTDFHTPLDNSPGFDSIISIYEERKLNVAANLALAFKWKMSFNYTQKHCFILADKGKKFKQYKESVEKLLLLL